MSRLSISGETKVVMTEELMDRTQVATVEVCNETREPGDGYYRLDCQGWILDRDEVPSFIRNLQEMFRRAWDAVECIDAEQS